MKVTLYRISAQICKITSVTNQIKNTRSCSGCRDENNNNNKTTGIKTLWINICYFILLESENAPSYPTGFLFLKKHFLFQQYVKPHF